MLVRVALVLACCLAALGSASNNQRNLEAIESTEHYRDLKPLARPYHVEAVDEIDGLKVAIGKVGLAAWKIQVTNNREDDIDIDWDASTFVTPQGESAGRLIRGSTRKMDTGRAQPRSVVAPGSTMTETALVEEMIGVESLTANVLPGGIPDARAENIERLFAKSQRLIVGGKLRLRIEIGGEKKTWVGTVVSADAVKKPDDE